MAEVLVQFDTPVVDSDGVGYIVRACGRKMPGSEMWEGWIEFDPGSGGVVLRTGRETEQHDRSELEYWATGLTVTYLEGALDRARNHRAPDLRPRTVEARPAYEGPAAHIPEPAHAPTSSPAATSAPTGGGAVLNPLAVYAQGEHVLREELSALNEGHLRNIIRTYDLVHDEELDLGAMSRNALAETIVAAVRKRLAG